MTESGQEAVRTDRWLWAARAYRSRSLAAQACDGGKVEVNGMRVKPHKLLRPGDVIGLTTPAGTRRLKVVATAERRGSASQAQTLYEDLTPAKPREERSLARRERGTGRPTKRERRQLDRWAAADFRRPRE